MSKPVSWLSSVICRSIIVILQQHKSASAATINAYFITLPSLKDLLVENTADSVQCSCRSLTFSVGPGAASWFHSTWTFWACRVVQLGEIHLMVFEFLLLMLVQVILCGQGYAYVTNKTNGFHMWEIKMIILLTVWVEIIIYLLVSQSFFNTDSRQATY